MDRPGTFDIERAEVVAALSLLTIRIPALIPPGPARGVLVSYLTSVLMRLSADAMCDHRDHIADELAHLCSWVENRPERLELVRNNLAAAANTVAAAFGARHTP